jgi:hypothetical protein
MSSRSASLAIGLGLAVSLVAQVAIAIPTTISIVSVAVNGFYDFPTNGGQVILGAMDGPRDSATLAQISDARVDGTDCVGPGLVRCGDAVADASARADFGSVGVATNAFAGGHNGGAANSGAQAEAEYFDEVTATSATLPFGTLVHGELTLTADFVASSSVVSNTEGLPEFATAAVTASASLNGMNSQLACAAAVVGPETTCGPGPEVVLVGDFLIGTKYNLVGDLAAFSGAQGTSAAIQGMDDDGFAHATVNAFHTASVFLTPLGDFQFVAESGHDYSRPVNVPEPRTLTLLAFGLTAMGLMRIRRKSSRRPRVM